MAIKAGVRLARRLYAGATLQVRGARGRMELPSCKPRGVHAPSACIGHTEATAA